MYSMTASFKVGWYKNYWYLQFYDYSPAIPGDMCQCDDT